MATVGSRQWKNNVAKGIQRAVQTTSYRRKRRKIANSLWSRPAYRKRHRKSMESVWASKKFREGRAENGRKVLKKLWKDPEFVEKVNASHVNPSQQHLSIFRRLCREGFRGCKLEFSVGRYVIDIAFPKKKIAIEVDGHYWHRIRKNSDRRKTKFLSARGWRIVRLPVRKMKDAKIQADRLIRILRG